MSPSKALEIVLAGIVVVFGAFFPWIVVCRGARGVGRRFAMAGLIKNLRVTKTGPGSRSLEEAQQRATDFFREACRALPSIMERYNLYEVITLSDLRSKIASEFRKHHHNTNPKVVSIPLPECNFRG